MPTRSFISEITGQANDQEKPPGSLYLYSKWLSINLQLFLTCLFILHISPFPFSLSFVSNSGKIKPRLSHFMGKSLAWRENYQIPSVAALFRGCCKINIDSEWEQRASFTLKYTLRQIFSFKKLSQHGICEVWQIGMNLEVKWRLNRNWKRMFQVVIKSVKIFFFFFNYFKKKQEQKIMQQTKIMRQFPMLSRFCRETSFFLQ